MNRTVKERRPALNGRPVPGGRPSHWLRTVNAAESEAELAAVRHSVQRGTPYGDEKWMKQTAARLSLETTLRPRGRPRKAEA